jgi:hypothetical protein
VLVVAQVRPARLYLAPTGRVGPSVPPVVEEDISTVVGLDDALEVGGRTMPPGGLWSVST